MDPDIIVLTKSPNTNTFSSADGTCSLTINLEEAHFTYDTWTWTWTWKAEKKPNIIKKFINLINPKQKSSPFNLGDSFLSYALFSINYQTKIEHRIVVVDREKRKIDILYKEQDLHREFRLRDVTGAELAEIMQKNTNIKGKKIQKAYTYKGEIFIIFLEGEKTPDLFGYMNKYDPFSSLGYNNVEWTFDESSRSDVNELLQLESLGQITIKLFMDSVTRTFGINNYGVKSEDTGYGLLVGGAQHKVTVLDKPRLAYVRFNGEMMTVSAARRLAADGHGNMCGKYYKCKRQNSKKK